MIAPVKSVARIFVAEDNPADVYLIERALKEHRIDFELEVAENGKQALFLLQREDRPSSEGQPALILLDLNLPQHDGTEILHCIRNNPRLASVPVVVFTSSDSPKDLLDVMQSGADRYIRKPSSLDDFMAIGAALKDILDAGKPGQEPRI
jgi:two-component system, chemotaxis family, response regulator Rcp1